MHMFLCGSKSFGHQAKNGSSESSPKRSKRSKSFSNFNTNNKNPYANRGLDKFLALVADLDEKKQKIYEEMGSEDISFIRFVYSDDSEQVKPIVVRANNNNKRMLFPPPNIKAGKSIVEEKREVQFHVKPQEEMQAIKRSAISFYFLITVIMLVLILVLLAIYGRSLAILCTSIAWYLVPQFIVRSSKRKVW